MQTLRKSHVLVSAAKSPLNKSSFIQANDRIHGKSEELKEVQIEEISDSEIDGILNPKNNY